MKQLILYFPDEEFFLALPPDAESLVPLGDLPPLRTAALPWHPDALRYRDEIRLRDDAKLCREAEGIARSLHQTHVQMEDVRSADEFDRVDIDYHADDIDYYADQEHRLMCKNEQQEEQNRLLNLQLEILHDAVDKLTQDRQILTAENQTLRTSLQAAQQDIAAFAVGVPSEVRRKLDKIRDMENEIEYLAFQVGHLRRDALPLLPPADA